MQCQGGIQPTTSPSKREIMLIHDISVVDKSVAKRWEGGDATRISGQAIPAYKMWRKAWEGAMPLVYSGQSTPAYKML